MGTMAANEDKTEMLDQTRWHPPVPNKAAFPTEGLTEGLMCFVTGESKIYMYKNGEWTTSPPQK